MREFFEQLDWRHFRKHLKRSHYHTFCRRYTYNHLSTRMCWLKFTILTPARDGVEHNTLFTVCCSTNVCASVRFVWVVLHLTRSTRVATRFTNIARVSQKKHSHWRPMITMPYLCKLIMKNSTIEQNSLPSNHCILGSNLIHSECET